jgi:hypothetical protein
VVYVWQAACYCLCLPSVLPALYDKLGMRKEGKISPLRLKMRSPTNNKGCQHGISFSDSDAQTSIPTQDTIWFSSTAIGRLLQAFSWDIPGSLPLARQIARYHKRGISREVPCSWLDDIQACRRRGENQRFASLASAVSW